jgi:DNA-binding response OmpR family regulator
VRRYYQRRSDTGVNALQTEELKFSAAAADFFLYRGSIGRVNHYDPRKYLATVPGRVTRTLPLSRKSSYTQVVDARILVVEDDLTVAEVVVEYLRHAGMEARHAVDGPSGLEIAAAWRPDLVVLDLMLPGLSGLEVCRRLREERDAQSPPLPVIMLTALTEESDRVLGLESGADDYVTKPFSPRELTLRVQAVLRRARTVDAAAAAPPRLVRSGRLEVDVSARRARRDGEELELTVREFDLLAFFVSHPGRAFTRAQLLEQVWGYSFGDQSTVTVYVRRLRDKVEPEPAAPVQLQTVWGVGYRWETGS